MPDREAAKVANDETTRKQPGPAQNSLNNSSSDTSDCDACTKSHRCRFGLPACFRHSMQIGTPPEAIREGKCGRRGMHVNRIVQQQHLFPTTAADNAGSLPPGATSDAHMQ